MKNEEIKKLALSLAMAETEKEVVHTLEKAFLWSDSKAWKEFNGSSGNWSTIGNQQSSADAALVEKIVNAVDAVLTRECLREGILPESANAPKSISEAQKKYFGIYNGKLSSVDAGVRARLAENIFLVATGEDDSDINPSYAVIDSGEGQMPEAFHDTFLSLTKGNKSKIQFVQGKFGMGGTGVFRFGSPEHNLQLIISKRDPKIKYGPKSDYWGMTVIRRIPPTGQMKSSIFTYLAPENKILSFTSSSLPLLPDVDLQAYKKPLEHGTFVKIYEYKIGTGRLKSDATRHLHNRLSLLMPNIALPIKVADIRYKKSPIKTLSGLSVRLDDDKRENLEENFPSSGELTIKGEKMDYSIYAFKAGKRDTYAGKEGIIFTVNGQTHGSIPKNFFENKIVGMSYLSDSILVIVDCTKIDRRMHEDLFMNSRDRLVEGMLKDEIEDQFGDIIKNHPGLKTLREKRRREDIENKLQDSKPLADVLEKIIKKSPSLSSLFMQGVRIQNPFNLTGVIEHGEFKGKNFPTYFTLVKEYTKEKAKLCPINRKFRIQYETDANNDYFNRDKEPGELTLKISNTPIEDYSLNLWNGLATLTIGLPQDSKIGDTLCFQTTVIDYTRVEAITSEFCVKVEEQQTKNEGHGGGRKEPSSKETGKDRQKPSYLNIPNAIEIRRNEWGKHKFDEKSALKVMDAGEDAGYDFFINMDNVYLQMEIKENTKIDPRLLEARFKYGMVLLGISLLDFEGRKKKEESQDTNENTSIYESIFDFSKAISPTLLPMISSLGDLELDA
jgi:hypothetical protein